MTCAFAGAIFAGLSSPQQVAGQAGNSTGGIVLRIGNGLKSRGLGYAYGLGLEVEALPYTKLVPSLRIDYWDFGIGCLDSPCPSGVATYAAGLRYQSAVAWLQPYAGGDVGYMAWASEAKGISLRARTGVDVRIFRPLGLNVDAAYVRYIRLGNTSARMYQDGLLTITAGGRLWW
jgi:hypothetical protein